MRIGFDAKRAFHNFTGLGNYSRFVISALQEHFPDNTYFLYTPTNKKTQESDFISEHGVVVEAPFMYQKTGLKSIWRSLKLYDTAKNHKLDIFHGLSNEIPLSKTGDFKKVVTVHDLIALRYPELYPRIDRTIYKYKFRKSFDFANHIVAISNQTKEDIIEFFKVPESKISVIYQGVHDNFLKDIKVSEMVSIKEKYNLPDRYLLNVGTIEKRKNLLILLKALLQVENELPLVVIGKQTNYQQEINDFIQKNRLQSRVFFYHSIDFEDLPGIYHLSDLFIYPSIFEGFGIPIIEAIQCGKPVITSTGSCFGEAGGTAAKYIDPDDDVGLAKTIDQIIESDQLTDTLVSNGRQHLENFSKQKIAADLMELYQRIIG